ncbi:hypothetical protein EVAR_95997_1 [Eumeta japonica]|uniref:Uncharacterized protein n=1 Tax=Eumeta variegata TaxID=151549 RepID=A0A4C1ZXY4_EUMVA|nr:hypothetical protein EVAR_95997_1 [Eumeta japonica]
MPDLCSGISHHGPLVRRRIVRLDRRFIRAAERVQLVVEAASTRPYRAVRIGAIGVHVSVSRSRGCWDVTSRHLLAVGVVTDDPPCYGSYTSPLANSSSSPFSAHVDAPAHHRYAASGTLIVGPVPHSVNEIFKTHI